MESYENCYCTELKGMRTARLLLVFHSKPSRGNLDILRIAGNIQRLKQRNRLSLFDLYHERFGLMK